MLSDVGRRGENVPQERWEYIYKHFADLTMSEVLSWPVMAAQPDSSSKVAVTVLPQGVNSGDYVSNNVAYVVKSVMHRLGPDWCLQIFHGAGQRQEIEDALGE